MKERLTLNKKEQTRLIVLSQVESNKLDVRKGGLLLKLSERHMWRLLAAYRRSGAEGLVHGNRDRKPVNTLPAELKEQVFRLATSKYAGFNHTHFTEKLAECEQTYLSRSTVRRILLEKGVRSPRKRQPPRYRSRRERYPREGMLLQTDGSPHDWLEGRGPQLCLIGAIDDATSKVPYALFQEQETTEGYMWMLWSIVLKQGIPLAIYRDHHSIFEVSLDSLPSLEAQLNGQEPKTQLGRILEELGIESIAANSPQAKGRIERLWGTFQDRLVSELRLVGAKTLEEANQVLARFLPEYNQKFAVTAREPDIAYRKVEEGFKPEEFFCFKYQRVVGADNVVRFKTQRFQVLPSWNRLSYARCKVEVQVRLDGSFAIYYQGKPLDMKFAPKEPDLLRKSNLVPVAAGTPVRVYKKPSQDHPWRGIFRTHLD